MSLFPGNILVIDDQFNLCYAAEPDDAAQKIQRSNFIRLKSLFDTHGYFFSVITETSDLDALLKKMKKYQNVRMLVLDLDLDESGEVEEGDVAMVRKIISFAIESFGYFFLAINSSYSEKWDDIRNEWTAELEEDKKENHKTLNFLNNYTVSFNKELETIEKELLNKLTEKFAHELITQFECSLNKARDLALSPFMDVRTKTWDKFYSILKEDMDSREHINLTLNSFLLGLLRQHIISSNYTPPKAIAEGDVVDTNLHTSIIKGFNFLYNTSGVMDNHPIWTGNIYIDPKKNEDKYVLIITPECDIAQVKGEGYTVLRCTEFNDETFPSDYNPKNFKDKEAPLLVKRAGKNGIGDWKAKNDIKDYYKGPGFYLLYYATCNNDHIVINLRSVTTLVKEDIDKMELILRVNEPIITDIMDRFSGIYNRKGLPRLTDKKFNFLGQ
jgi:hypothetical protein